MYCYVFRMIRGRILVLMAATFPVAVSYPRFLGLCNWRFQEYKPGFGKVLLYREVYCSKLLCPANLLSVVCLLTAKNTIMCVTGVRWRWRQINIKSYISERRVARRLNFSIPAWWN